MPIWVEVLLQILVATIPALVVFFTIYFLMKQFFDAQRQARQYDLHKSSQSQGLPLKMQAYERLSLFCERIALPNLLLRIRKNGMSVSEFRLALLLAIQQEYEHNVTQQVYVSSQLWEIIKLAKDFSLDVISAAAEGLSSRADAQQLADAIIRKLQEQPTDPLQQAQLAIKKEAALYLG